MKLPEHRFRALLSEHVLFSLYRWGMWVIAALLVALFATQLPRSQTFYLSVLLVLAALTILATTLAKQYVRLVHHYPLVSLVDLLVGLALVWISGGWLPFLPYALGGLVLPTWYLFRRVVGQPVSVTAHHSQTTPPDECDYLSCEVNTSNHPCNSLVSKSGECGREPRLVDTSLATVETTRQVVAAEMRSAAEQGPQALRQIIYAKLTPSTDVDLPVALDQIVHSFRRSVNMPMHLNRVGYAQKLSPAKHLTLIRLAQEALLNVQQHSHASSASLTLCYEPDMITLTVKDNGGRAARWNLPAARCACLAVDVLSAL